MLEKNEDVRAMCESLSTENKQYVLAVAQALKFTQCNSKNSCTNSTRANAKQAS